MPIDCIRDGTFGGRTHLSPPVYIFWQLRPVTCRLLPFPDHQLSTPRSVTVILEMGRRPWGTPEQLVFLRSFVHLLTKAKESSGLETLYSQVYDSFLKNWIPEPVVRKPDESPQDHEARAKKRLRSRISNWYKEERKKTKHGAALPYSNPAPNLIDLSGKLKRKKLPYKLHQAFSILYWRPPDSPLRLEVESFWTRRSEDSVHEILKPFLKEAVKTSTSSSEKLVFHMAVMRWKCSLLTPDELTTLQDWIDEQHKSKEKIRSLPWSDEASEHGDTLFTENTYTQCAIDDLAPTVQRAIEEIERLTGWKAMVILGGLEPRVGGISSHLYVTGKSEATGQTFPEAHPEVSRVRTMFHEWLRTAYSDEEKKKKSLQGAVSFISMATSHPEDTGVSSAASTAAASTDAVADTPPDVNTDPMYLPPPIVPNISNPQHPGTPVSPPPVAGAADHTPYADPGGASPRTPSPLPEDFPNPPPTPSPSPLSPSRSNTSTPETIPTQPLLPSARNGAFNLTGVRGDFISEDTREYWESVPGGDKWVEMVTSYLMLETMVPLKSQLHRLPTASRPQTLQTWLKSGKRSLGQVPTIGSACTYGTEWVKWWTAAQPREYDTQEWPFSRDTNSDVDWCKFPANGKDGVFLAVMALSWWAPAARSSDEIASFEEAVIDLHWVICELIRVRTVGQLSPPPPSQSKPKTRRPKPTIIQPNPISNQSASTSLPPASSSRPPMSASYGRAAGKRVVKPSRKVLDNQ